MKDNKSTNFSTLDLTYIGLSTALIAVCAWISIPIATVPVTLQTLAVCLVAALFGWKKGVASVLIYLIIGAFGVPVFAQFKGGIGVLFGMTGGYLMGFVLTALIVGLATEKWGNKLLVLAVSMVLGVLVCYVFGTAWFALIYAKQTEPVALGKILSWCVIPFILPDLIKIAVACVISSRVKKYIK
ncbi:MAG: biotin transporter BioY [Eubacterium sp.]|nr:biotin transporter BioY [Eubacterium sp.]